MSYTLDTKSAKSADNLVSSIRESGKYIGTLTRAEALLSPRGTKGLGLSFKAADGATADYLDLYTHNEAGEELPSLKVVHALLACLKLRNINDGAIRFEKWNSESKAREQVTAKGYPELMGKRIGFLFRKELQTNDKTGADVNRLAIFGVFQADTELTASEVLDQKTKPERLPKMLEALFARPVVDRRKPTTGKTHHELKHGHPAPPASSGGAFSDMDDDIPFANPYRGKLSYLV